MKMMECPREQELIDAVTRGQWPNPGPAELRAHVAQCSVCTDVLEVAAALYEDREAAQLNVSIPSAGLVWWRAELRARQEAMRTASRPITFVQAFGAAAAGGVSLAILRRLWPSLKTFVSLPNFSDMSLPQWSIVIAFGVAVLVIAPLAMYLVLSDD